MTGTTTAGTSAAAKRFWPSIDGGDIYSQAGWPKLTTIRLTDPTAAGVRRLVKPCDWCCWANGIWDTSPGWSLLALVRPMSPKEYQFTIHISRPRCKGVINSQWGCWSTLFPFRLRTVRRQALRTMIAGEPPELPSQRIEFDGYSGSPSGGSRTIV